MSLVTFNGIKPKTQNPMPVKKTRHYKTVHTLLLDTVCRFEMCYNVATENAPWNYSVRIPPPPAHFHTVSNNLWYYYYYYYYYYYLTTMSTAKATSVSDMYRPWDDKCKLPAHTGVIELRSDSRCSRILPMKPAFSSIFCNKNCTIQFI